MNNPTSSIDTTAPSIKPRLAVVDDDPRILAMLQDELRDMGVEACLCPDGYALLELMPSDPVHLVLLDLIRPGLDGIPCLARLRDMH